MNLRYLSMSQLSEVTGLDRRTVKDRLSKIKPYRVEGKAIQYDCRKALPILFGFDNPEKKDLSKQLQEQELKLQIAKTEILESELKTIRAEHVAIEDVCKVVEKEFNYVRSSIQSIPSKCAKALSIETEPSIIQSVLSDHINEVLSHLQADVTYSENDKKREKENSSEEDGDEN